MRHTHTHTRVLLRQAWPLKARMLEVKIQPVELVFTQLDDNVTLLIVKLLDLSIEYGSVDWFHAYKRGV